MNHKFYTTVLLFSILMQSCISQEQPESLVKEDMPDFIYPKYRRWMSPDNNITARFSSPSLEWPSDKSSLYDVRIATDPEFKNLPLGVSPQGVGRLRSFLPSRREGNFTRAFVCLGADRRHLPLTRPTALI